VDKAPILLIISIIWDFYPTKKKTFIWD